MKTQSRNFSSGFAENWCIIEELYPLGKHKLPMMNRTAYVHMQCLRKHDLRTQATYHINFSLGHLMFLDFWLKKKQAKSHKFLSWPLDSILDFWLIHQHQFNGPINLIIIEISKEKHRDEHHVLFFFFFIIVGVRASLRAPRLISRALKLTTM